MNLQVNDAVYINFGSGAYLGRVLAANDINAIISIPITNIFLTKNCHRDYIKVGKFIKKTKKSLVVLD